MGDGDTLGANHDEELLDYYYFHPDHLGSSSYITNGVGTISQHMEYLPFGETLVDEHINSKNSPFKYNGKEFDEETGNYYYGARYYDPKLSIFISVDPLAEKYPSFSSYCYTMNNPINLVDSDGRHVEPSSQKDWDIHKKNVISERDRLQNIIDEFKTKAAEKGWSAQKLSNKIGDKQDRVNSMTNTLSNLDALEKSPQGYALNTLGANAKESGGTRYDSTSGNIVFDYDGSTSNFVYETTDGGQFESQDIGFDKTTGKGLAMDVFDEVAAYQAQYAYSPSSVSGLNSSSTASSFAGITSSWVQGLTTSLGNKPYAPGGANNIGIVPININSNKNTLILAYPHIAQAFKNVSSNFTLKTHGNIHHK